MKYMLLIYLDENGLTEDQQASCYRESAQYAVRLSQSGNYLGAGPLHPTSTATSVRIRDNQRVDLTSNGLVANATTFVQSSTTVGITPYPAYYQKPQNFLKPNAAYAPRQIQLALKLIF